MQWQRSTEYWKRPLGQEQLAQLEVPLSWVSLNASATPAQRCSDLGCSLNLPGGQARQCCVGAPLLGVANRLRLVLRFARCIAVAFAMSGHPQHGAKHTSAVANLPHALGVAHFLQAHCRAFCVCAQCGTFVSCDAGLGPA